LCCLFFFDMRFLITSLWYLQTLHHSIPFFKLFIIPYPSSNSSSFPTLLQTVRKFYNYSVKLEVKKIKVYIKRSSITLNWL
jgi:hypothetical protein